MNKFFTVIFFLALALTASDKPNVILIMTDDQGYGDFGNKGNHLIQTPHIDKMATESFEFTRFYVNAVCSPTRASVMTGRQSYRTGVTDTWIGRSTMFAEEVTIAEILKDAGYGTGLFGKWHLGDNYPYRPMDQGFDKAIYHKGGGLGQPADPVENERRYTDAILFDNGEAIQTKGFCCDVYFDEAMRWMTAQKNADKPFFAFIASNTPHSPFHDVPQKWYDYYRQKNLGKANFKQDKGHKILGKDDNDRTAAIYAMVSNVDDNVGRLFSYLKDQNLDENTLVIYMSDNGPHGYRYVSGFKGTKSMNTEGGLRTPIWFYYPKEFKAGATNNNLAAHIDLMPTLAEFCGAKMPIDKTIDGISLLPALKGKVMNKRKNAVIIQSHRGTQPEHLNNTAIYRDQWKFMTVKGQKPVLFDMEKDPYAQTNVIDQHPEVSKSLVAEYTKIMKECESEYKDMWGPKPIFLGTKYETETHLSRQEWRDMVGKGWSRNDTNGTWYMDVKKAGKYKIAFNLLEPIGKLKAVLKIDDKSTAKLSSVPAKWYEFPLQELKQGPLKIKVDINNGSKIGPWHVKILPAN